MIQELYNDYLEKGHCKMSALGIIMHKILRIVYGMLKHKQSYDPNVDRANRKKVIKTKQEQESKKVDKSRRYQPYDKNAPVSKRQAKKRELTDTEVVEVVTQNGTSSQVSQVTRYPKHNRRTGEKNEMN